MDLMSAQMADKANPCTEDTLAVGTRDEGDVILRITGSGFPGLPPLLCCSGPRISWSLCARRNGTWPGPWRFVPRSRG